jgi:hypothetical protein
VKLSSAIANTLWSVANLPAYRQFQRDLADPATAQARRLQACLLGGAATTFAQVHGLAGMDTYEAFATRVPLMDYDALEPWITRIRQGEPNVLTRERITRLVPTSGSSGARKLIPFTAGLQREFGAALGPWLVDLRRRHLGLGGGPAYWSVTPVLDNTAATEESAVPIGFDADTAYLGGLRQRLAAAVMAAPEQLRLVRELETFRYVTLLCLLRERELRLISVWHPSFLTLLLDALPGYWEELLADLQGGGCRHRATLPPALNGVLDLHPMPGRAAELRRADPRRPESLWPCLRLISCWADAAAALPAADLQDRFPRTAVQAKGLLATEAMVSVPFAGAHPVAVNSHFYEFIDAGGGLRRVHELAAGQTYEVVVTTGGGLWRYRLGDVVEVTGFLGRTPTLRFLGRHGNVSDLCGEKLAEPFVNAAIAETLAALQENPGFVLLAPDVDDDGLRYTLYLEGPPPRQVVDTLERSLRRNPHYAYCRDLGQLLPLRLFTIAGRGYETFARRQSSGGACLGGVKPATFSRQAGWSKVFDGRYV